MKHTTIKAVVAVVAAVIMIAAIFLGVVAFRELNAAVHMVYEGETQLATMEPIISSLEKEAENSSDWIMENTRNNLKFLSGSVKSWRENCRPSVKRMRRSFRGRITSARRKYTALW